MTTACTPAVLPARRATWEASDSPETAADRRRINPASLHQRVEDARDPLAIFIPSRFRQEQVDMDGYPISPRLRIDNQELYDACALFEGLRLGRGSALFVSAPRTVQETEYRKYLKHHTDWKIRIADQTPGCSPENAMRDYLEVTFMEQSLGARELKPTIIIVGSGAIPVGAAVHFLRAGGRLVVMGFRDLMPARILRLLRQFGVAHVQLYDFAAHLGLVRLRPGSRVLASRVTEATDIPLDFWA